VTLLKAAVGSRDFVRAYAYTGLDPENENQRNFHAFLARHDYKVVSKDIASTETARSRPTWTSNGRRHDEDGRNLDVAILVSGDGDFAPAIRAVQEMGVRVEVISFRGNTSSDLIDVRPTPLRHHPRWRRWTRVLRLRAARRIWTTRICR